MVSTRDVLLSVEVDEMRAAGYVTPASAATAAGVSLNWPYRAMRSRAVPFRYGANNRSRYIHRDKWVAWVRVKRDAQLRRVGVKVPR